MRCLFRPRRPIISVSLGGTSRSPLPPFPPIKLGTYSLVGRFPTTTMNQALFHSSRFPLFVLASAMFVVACARDSAAFRWDPLSPAERELRERVEDLRDTVWEGTTVTAIVGALLGGAVGGAQGAARGAEAGRLAGAAAGRYVAWQQALHEERAAALRAIASDLKAVNAKTAALVASVEMVVAQQQVTLARREENVKIMKKGLATAWAQNKLARESRSELAKKDAEGLESIEEQIVQHERHIGEMEEIVHEFTRA